MPIDLKSLKNMLVCPGSKSGLVAEAGRLVCVDPECRLSFDIRDDIPVMLVDEATTLALEDWSAVMEQHGRDKVTGAVAEPNA